MPLDQKAAPVSTPDPLARLADAVQTNANNDEPRHMRLRAAFLDMLANRAWAPGDKLPPEREIADAVGLSLGTVQKVLGRLASDSVLIRRHGHGTFVAAVSQADQLLHFRFVGDDGSALLPVFAEAIDRKVVSDVGPWSSLLKGATSFIRVRRRINVANEFDCLSEFFIDADRFREVMSIPFSQLHRVMIRTILAERFDAPTLSIEQRIYAAEFPKDVAELLKLRRKQQVGMTLEVASYTHHLSPVSFQLIHIPPGVRPLEIPARKVQVR